MAILANWHSAGYDLICVWSDEMIFIIAVGAFVVSVAIVGLYYIMVGLGWGG